MSYSFERQKREVFPTPKVPFEISLFQTVLNGLIEGKIISSTKYFDIEKYTGDEFIDVLIQQDSKFFLELLTDEQQEILIVHLFLQGKGEEALNLIEKRGKESISRDVLNDRIFPYFKKNFATSNQIFFRLVKLLSTYPKFYSESYEGVFPMVRSTILSLLEATTEYAAIRDIINEFFPKGEKDIALLTVEVLEGKRDITKHDTQLFTRPHIQKILSSLSSYLKLLDSKGVDALILGEIIEIIELTGKTLKYAKLSDIYEIKSKVRSRLCELGKFDEVEVFLEATGDIKYYKGSLLQQKFNYFLRQKKKEESQKTLHDLFQYHEFTEGNITEKIEEASRQIKWHTRLENYETLAEILLNKVLFEATFGGEESAKQYMSILVDLVRRISIPCDTELIEKIQKYHNGEKDHGINRYEKRCLGHLKRRRLRVKRDIKTHMLNLGFEHLLPKTEGWRDSIQSTQTLEEKYEAKQKRREERGKQRESQIEESNKKYWENEDQRATEVVESLFSQEHNTTTNILDNFFKEYSSDFGWSIRRAWNASNVLIERVPQLYPQVLDWLLSRTFTQLQIGYDHSGNIEVRGEDYSYITKFFLFGFEKELITTTDIYKLAEAGKRYLQDRRGSYTESQFYEFLLFPLIKILCEAGKLQEAWQVFYSVYEKKEKHSDEQVSQKILGFFYGFLKDTPGFQFLESQEFNPQLDIKQQILFYNSKIEIALASKNEEEYEINRKQLQQLFSSDAEVLLFINLLNTGTIRSHHQKKEELMSIYSSTYISEKVRRRIVKTLIEHKTTGVQTLSEVRGHKNSYRVGIYFFNKLVQSGVLSPQTRDFLSKDTYLYLRQILSEFQNEFNTVIESLSSYYETNRWLVKDQEKKEPLKKSDWEGILKILRILGVFSMGIFSEARKEKYETQKLLQIKDTIKRIKKSLFVNGEISDVNPDLLAEVIYFAYKPAQMSLSQVIGFCGTLKDCSHHLNKWKFRREGDILNLLGRKEMKLKTGVENVSSPAKIGYIDIKTQKGNGSKKDLAQQRARKLFEIGRMKFTSDMDINDIMLLFMGDNIVENAMGNMSSIRTQNSLTQTYQILKTWQEILGVYLEDNLEKCLTKYFQKNLSHISGMLHGFAQSVRGGKLKRSLEMQLGIAFDTSLNDIELSSKVISQIVKAKYKPLHDLRKSIQADVKKFVTIDGENVSEKSIQLKAIVSKSKASFFAKASAGICTASDTQLFEREDHFHINIIDEEKQICVGNVQAYIMPKGEEIYLLLRGINPSTNVLKDIDAKSFTEAIIERGKTFCRENNLKGLILSTQGNSIALSNRPEIASYIEKTYVSTLRDIPPFNIVWGYVINQGYIIS